MATSKTSRYQSLKELGGLDMLPPEVVRAARQQDSRMGNLKPSHIGPTKEKLPFDRKPFESKLDIPRGKEHRTSTKDVPPAEKR